MLGHDGAPTSIWKKNLIDGKPLERCPVRTLQLADQSLVSEIHRHVNEYFPYYEDGFLLAEGGIADQPARYLAYMREIPRMRFIIDAKYKEARGEDSE